MITTTMTGTVYTQIKDKEETEHLAIRGTSGRGPREGCSRWWHGRKHALENVSSGDAFADAQLELRPSNQVFDTPK